MRTSALLATRAVAAATVPVSVLALAACGGGGSSSGTDAAAAPAASSAADGAAPPDGAGMPGGGRGGFDSEQFTQIRDCLTAAGISVPTPTARPDFTPGTGFTPRPDMTGRPTARPTDLPTGAPGQGGRGFGGGIGAVLQDPQAQAAITACGLEVPSVGSRGGATVAAPQSGSSQS
ncbi:hypothetical protein [Motilibacter deserti]|uniref:Uncharacterized protein n=1 Tax=Motilibacter deserti TaxID=2714956 RepID=A0ABX0GPE8_9ACTN|nr:hypothetical protein [Motilibacter deserti]NHC12709.1 hypothetical protein [Motilibacter deserti]